MRLRLSVYRLNNQGSAIRISAGRIMSVAMPETTIMLASRNPTVW